MKQLTIIAVALLASALSAVVVLLAIETPYAILVGFWLTGLIFGLSLLPAFAVARRYGVAVRWGRSLLCLSLLAVSYPVVVLLIFGYVERYEAVGSSSGSVLRPEADSASAATVLAAAILAALIWILLMFVTGRRDNPMFFALLGGVEAVSFLGSLSILSSGEVIAMGQTVAGLMCGIALARAIPPHMRVRADGNNARLSTS